MKSVYYRIVISVIILWYYMFKDLSKKPKRAIQRTIYEIIKKNIVQPKDFSSIKYMHSEFKFMVVPIGRHIFDLKFLCFYFDGDFKSPKPSGIKIYDTNHSAVTYPDKIEFEHYTFLADKFFNYRFKSNEMPDISYILDFKLDCSIMDDNCYTYKWSWKFKHCFTEFTELHNFLVKHFKGVKNAK
jgi:hypothetical protein